MPADRNTDTFARIAVLPLLACLSAAPAAAGDWSGFFLGAASASAAGEAAPGGIRRSRGRVRLGYNQDFGSVVLGGEIGVPDSGTDFWEGHQRLQLRAGYDFGPALGYVTVGGIQAPDRTDGGAVFSLGLSFSLNRALYLSGELLRNQAAVSAPGGLPAGESFALQAAFRF